MNILIVEDDRYLSDKIYETFSKSAPINQVKVLHSYEEFLSHANNFEVYDMVLLDIMLSKDTNKTGLQILEHIRKTNTHIPIIIMSSMSDYTHLEKAFSLWAHDYVIKPFRIRELQIRVQRWFHNYVFAGHYNYERQLDYAGVSYFPSKNDFQIDGQSLQLSRANKYLLSLFLIHREKLLTHMFLIEKIWWYSEVMSEKNLRIKILRLKKQLAPYGLDEYISTIRGEGYIFEYKATAQAEK